MADTVSANKNDSEYAEIIDPPAVRESKIKQLAALIRKHKGKVTFYTGAGISTGAGIPDFRSGIGSVTGMPAGKWCHDATKKDWNAKETKEDRNRRKRTTSTLQAIPTASHMALVELASRGFLRGLISQNCDGLHRRSGFPSNLLAELHGNGNLEYCGWCGREYMRDFHASRGRHTKGRVLRQKLWPEHKKIKGLINPRRGRHYTGRRCMAKNCDGYLFDSTIDFGDNLPEKHLLRGYQYADECELCIVLGSRCSVSPACEMPISVGQTKNKTLVVVNLQRTAADKFARLRIGAKIDDVMVPVMEQLGIPIPPFILSRLIRVKNVNEKELVVGGFDPDGTPNDLIWNIQARLAAETDIESNENSFKTSPPIHSLYVRVNQDMSTTSANMPKVGDLGCVTKMPWLNCEHPGHVNVRFNSGKAVGHTFALPPGLLTVVDKQFTSMESSKTSSIQKGAGIASMKGTQIERLWSDGKWYQAIIMGLTTTAKLRLYYPQTHEEELVDPSEFSQDIEWRYSKRDGKKNIQKTVSVVNAGESYGQDLLHRVSIKDPSLKVLSLQIMFRSHYREPPLTLPVPKSGTEEFHRLLYSPARGIWEIQRLSRDEITNMKSKLECKQNKVSKESLIVKF